MFTGLIQSTGTLVRRTQRGADARLVVRGELVGDLPGTRDPIVLGESIAIDGVCLTVDAILEPGGPGPTTFEVDASSETLAKTTLGGLAIGANVNLERAMPVGGRLGGHIVSGHVDGVGRVLEKRPAGASLEMVFEAPHELARFIAPKGSICINGVSLTVNGVSGSSFHVMLIPHTRQRTSLDSLPVGAPVNIEVDVLARYVARLLEVGRVDPASSETVPDSRLLERLRAAGYV